MAELQDKQMIRPASPAAEKKNGEVAEDVLDRQLEKEIDRISLIQALTDAEVATRRVIDLTERLVDARHELISVRSELDSLRIEYAQYRAEQEQMRSSQAYKIASRIWSIRNALGI